VVAPETEPLPPPVAVATPAPTPPASDAPAVVHFKVSSTAKKARVAFRGRMYMLPLVLDVKPGGAPESVEVTAPGHTGRRFWITFDREALDLTAPLSRGSGVTEATETETAVALGNAPPEALEPEPARRAPRPAAPSTSATPAAAVAAATPPASGAPTAAGASAPPAGPVAQPTPAPPPVAEAAAPKAESAPPKPAEPLLPGESETGEVAVINPFESADMRNAINSQMNTLKACTQAAHQDNPDFSGNVTITIELEPEGTVASASANAGPGNSKFATCLIKTLRKWKFPKPPSGKRTRMIFPLFLG
jgi:hypothetical protein